MNEQNLNMYAEPTAQDMDKAVEQTDDFLISSDYYEEEQVNEADSIRYNYEDAYGEDYDGEIIISNLTSIYVSTKTKVSQRTGKEYIDNTVITKLFCDSDEVKVTFFDKVFSRYDERKNRITTQGNEALAELVRGLTGNTRDNRFVLDLDKFQEKLATLDQVKVKIYSYDDKGYEKYSFKVLAYSEK